jgi:intermediate cleaving peptidase 55
VVDHQAFPNTVLASHLPALLRSEHLFVSLPPIASPSLSSQPLQPPPPRRRSSLLKLFTSDPSSSSSSWSSATDPPHLIIAAALASERARPLEREVHRLRLIKSGSELATMKRAADVSAAGHTRLMEVVRAGMREDRLAAEFTYICGKEGSEREAYVPVIASG